jgi:hypothetical protein
VDQQNQAGLPIVIYTGRNLFQRVDCARLVLLGSNSGAQFTTAMLHRGFHVPLFCISFNHRCFDDRPMLCSANGWAF